MDQFAKETLPISLEDEMRRSYLDYAMSVIVGRALPDARDGLKPVHRRVLYAMHETNNVWNRPFVKCARVVGEVMGKYHPHGDSAIYDTLVRMAHFLQARSETPGYRWRASAKVFNLSTSGAGLRSRQRLAGDGDVLRLKFKLSVHGVDTFVTVSGRICSITTKVDEPEMPFSYGIQFEEPDSQTHFSLAAFVYGILLGEV